MKREITYLSLYYHHQNVFCIKMGSDENHFNVSVGSDGQSHKIVSASHILFEEKGEPKLAVSNRGPSAYQPNALPLGQTGSLTAQLTYTNLNVIFAGSACGIFFFFFFFSLAA